MTRFLVFEHPVAFDLGRPTASVLNYIQLPVRALFPLLNTKGFSSVFL